MCALSQAQAYEEAAGVRDDAERLRHLLVRHRQVESLRLAGRLVLRVEGEGTVELDGGLLVESGSLFDAVRNDRTPPGQGGISGPTATARPAPGPTAAASSALDRGAAVSSDGHDNERVIVAQWLRANADKVRVLEAGDEVGLAFPADRVPTLGELCAALATGSGGDDRR